MVKTPTEHPSFELAVNVTVTDQLSVMWNVTPLAPPLDAASARASPATVTGGLALRFTGNFVEGCTAEQVNTYPETGADFEHSETRVP